ncbi:MAG: NAD(P)-binding protein [Methylovirgula sp.]
MCVICRLATKLVRLAKISRGWLDLAQAGRYQEAWAHILRDNPMPGVHGRVCYHPCETGCNRGAVDEPVGIHAVERFLGDRAMAEGWAPPQAAAASGKRVLIVGAGPAGLSAAYHLALAGHEVEIREAGAAPGGMLRFGIPAYRLPRDVLEHEVARITALGVRLILDHKVSDVLSVKAAGGFDAVFVAIGAEAPRRVEIPVRDAAHVVNAVDLLGAVGRGGMPKLGRRVFVYGAGDTAMDAARTALRLGAAETAIVFFSDRAHMEAHPFEAREAAQEGITFNWLSSVRDVDGEHVRIELMELDDKGVAHPTGRFKTLTADSVVLALGQTAESGFLAKLPGVTLNPDGTVQVGADLTTGAPGIFAGGDLVPGPRTVTQAVGDGKKAARNIDGYLRGKPYVHPPEHPGVLYTDLNLSIYTDAPQVHQPEVSADQRRDFAEFTGGLTAAQAVREAKRCFSCGNCYECDNCYAACPEQAISRRGVGKGYSVDLAKCTGCGACFEQCPCHAIEMEPEPA